MQLVLRVPRAQPRQPPQQPPQQPPDQANGPVGAKAGDSALGVDGIELREQSHEEALLSTIGACAGAHDCIIRRLHPCKQHPRAPTWSRPLACWRRLSPCTAPLVHVRGLRFACGSCPHCMAMWLEMAAAWCIACGGRGC